jgi:hypothetical protein
VDQPTPDAAVLRAEHDRLAAQVATRYSVDRVKEGGVLTFFTVISFGMSAKLAWDRWGWLPPRPQRPPDETPLWFLLACLVTLALVLYAVRAFRRAAALRVHEDAAFAKLLALRKTLGLDT